MNWTIFLVAVGGALLGAAGVFLFQFFAAEKWPSRPTPRDLRNCALLLAFLQRSFRGAVIGDLRMDELTQSLKNLLESLWGAEQP
jgi:hypothetical protein